jgi:UrcA family protein
MQKSIAFALALAAGLPATAAAANPVVKNEVVRFDDLNLASPAGVATLERRLTSAARRVCDYNETRGFSYIVSKDISTCMNNALASARQQVALKSGIQTRKG